MSSGKKSIVSKAISRNSITWSNISANTIANAVNKLKLTTISNLSFKHNPPLTIKKYYKTKINPSLNLREFPIKDLSKITQTLP